MGLHHSNGAAGPGGHVPADSLLQHYHIPGVSVLDVEGFSVAEDLFLITGRDSYHSRRVDLLIDYAVRFMGRTEGEA